MLFPVPYDYNRRQTTVVHSHLRILCVLGTSPGAFLRLPLVKINVKKLIIFRFGKGFGRFFDRAVMCVFTGEKRLFVVKKAHLCRECKFV